MLRCLALSRDFARRDSAFLDVIIATVSLTATTAQTKRSAVSDEENSPSALLPNTNAQMDDAFRPSTCVTATTTV